MSSIYNDAKQRRAARPHIQEAGTTNVWHFCQIKDRIGKIYLSLVSKRTIQSWPLHPGSTNKEGELARTKRQIREIKRYFQIVSQRLPAKVQINTPTPPCQCRILCEYNQSNLLCLCVYLSLQFSQTESREKGWRKCCNCCCYILFESWPQNLCAVLTAQRLTARKHP